MYLGMHFENLNIKENKKKFLKIKNKKKERKSTKIMLRY